MEDRYDISVDIGEGQERLLDELDPMAHDLGELEMGVIPHVKTLREEWELLEEQAKGLRVTMGLPSSFCEPMKPLSEEFGQEVLNFYKQLSKERKMEKKTKKMTKAEAFEYLKHKKVAVTRDTITLQNKLFNIGYKWCDGSIAAMPMIDFLLIDDETFQFTESLLHFSKCGYTEISADDILSMEIIDENKSEEEKALDKISCLGAQIVDILLRMKGHHHVTITETDVILHDEGMCLFHSDPF